MDKSALGALGRSGRENVGNTVQFGARNALLHPVWSIDEVELHQEHLVVPTVAPDPGHCHLARRAQTGRQPERELSFSSLVNCKLGHTAWLAR